MSKAPEKKVYERPSISKMRSWVTSKHGEVSGGSNAGVRYEIEGQKLADLTEKFGSPLFVYSESTILKKYRDAFSAFDQRYDNVQFAWSYKTNYLKSICSVFHKEGAWAEVVSEFEYDKALNSGVPGQKIIFNGPYKTREALKKAILNKSKIHIDNFEEISELESLAAEMNEKVSVGIRINLDCGIRPQWSKFGFNLENGEASAAVERILHEGNLSIGGLHSHIGTFVLDPGAYGRALTKLIAFSKQLDEKWQQHISYFDMGGGFASMSHLKGVYQPPEIVVPEVSSYAESICSVMNLHFPGKEKPQLILETGRHLIDEAGYLITSVVASKMTPDGRRNYIVDSGVNLLYTSTWYNYRVEVNTEVKGKHVEPAILSGSLCMNIDVIEESMMLPKLPGKTLLTLWPVGAYNVTQSMQFIHCRPAVVMIRKNGSVDVIRRQENLQDIEIGEVVPEDLKEPFAK